ncbi:DUF6559 family protein [Marinobacter shengliensis]
MIDIRRLYYEFQYSSYVRKLPFYLVRHYGFRRFYKKKTVDSVVRQYGFNARFSPIAYAIVSHPRDFEVSSRAFEPHPTRDYIRRRISSRYFAGNQDFDFLDLMKVSIFKSNWGSGGHSTNEEYWHYVGKLKSEKVNK